MAAVEESRYYGVHLQIPAWLRAYCYSTYHVLCVTPYINVTAFPELVNVLMLGIPAEVRFQFKLALC
jgi:hypothetical protein